MNEVHAKERYLNSTCYSEATTGRLFRRPIRLQNKKLPCSVSPRHAVNKSHFTVRFFLPQLPGDYPWKERGIFCRVGGEVGAGGGGIVVVSAVWLLTVQKSSKGQARHRHVYGWAEPVNERLMILDRGRGGHWKRWRHGDGRVTDCLYCVDRRQRRTSVRCCDE